MAPPEPDWPRTVADAAAQILATLTLPQSRQLLEMCREDLSRTHRGLGLGVRNGFGLWQGNAALLDDCERLSGRDFLEVDSASAIIVERAWELLRARSAAKELARRFSERPEAGRSQRLATLASNPKQGPLIREAALERLAHLGDAAVRPTLHAVLDMDRVPPGDDDGELRRRALELWLEYGVLDGEDAILVRALRHPAVIVSRRSVDGLRRVAIPIEVWVPALVLALRYRGVDRDVSDLLEELLPAWRAAAASGVVPPAAVSELARSLRPDVESDSRWIDTNQIDILIAAGPHPDVTSTLHQVYAAERGRREKDRIVRHLKRGDTVDDLVALVREKALSGDLNAIDHLLQLSFRARDVARTTLATLVRGLEPAAGDASARDEYAGERSLCLRLHASLALLRLDAGENLHACVSNVADALAHDVAEYDDGRSCSWWSDVDASRICAALVRVGGAAASALPALAQAAAGRRPRVRLTASAALWELGAPAALVIPVIQHALAELPDPNHQYARPRDPVRYALRALAPLGSNAAPVLPLLEAVARRYLAALHDARPPPDARPTALPPHWARLVQSAARIAARPMAVPDGPARSIRLP